MTEPAIVMPPESCCRSCGRALGVLLTTLCPGCRRARAHARANAVAAAIRRARAEAVAR